MFKKNNQENNPGNLNDAKKIFIIIIIFFLFLMINPIKVIPAGYVGIMDFFGSVSSTTLSPGIRLVVPFTKVIKMSVRTQELTESAETPSREGLIINLDVSLLYHINPSKAVDIYKTVGLNYRDIIVDPQLRSSIREITASYDTRALYSAERDKIAKEIFALVSKITQDRGIIVEQVLLRKIQLPSVVANAIQEKLKREQKAEQMKFVLLKEKQEAERKTIEAEGISSFQRIVTQGISPQLLTWKGIEATEKLSTSANTKVIVIGNQKGLPLILNSD